MVLTVLGSGTSHGVPVIGCSCRVCKSSDPKDSRLRCSAFVTNAGRNFLIDVGPDFRQQALRKGITSLDAVFLTHSHADHIHGIDDLRIFSHKNSRAMNEDANIKEKYPETAGEGLPIYSNLTTMNHIRQTFTYIFVDHDKGGGIPKLHFIPVEEDGKYKTVHIDATTVVPVPMIHGNRHTAGWLFISNGTDGKKHSIAYLTDCSFISDESIELVRENAFSDGGILDHLVIDALRVREHSSHNNFDQALEYADRIGAVHTWFTHMTHDLLHTEVQDYIDAHIEKHANLKKIIQDGGSVSPSYDGLELVTP